MRRVAKQLGAWVPERQKHESSTCSSGTVKGRLNNLHTRHGPRTQRMTCNIAVRNSLASLAGIAAVADVST